MPVMTVPQILRDKLSEEGAEALANLFNAFESQFKDTTLEIAEGRFENRLIEETSKIRNELTSLRSESKEDIANLRSELKEDIANLRGELKGDIGNLKNDVIRWIVGIAIAQAALLISILAFFFK
jgi:hypothetical protein